MKTAGFCSVGHILISMKMNWCVLEFTVYHISRNIGGDLNLAI